MHEPARDMYEIGKPLDPDSSLYPDPSLQTLDPDPSLQTLDLDPSLQTLDPDPLVPGFIPGSGSTSPTTHSGAY